MTIAVKKIAGIARASVKKNLFTRLNEEFINHPLIADANLLHYYPFEGNSNDYMGTKNGTDSGLGGYGTSYGKYRQGVYFDGVGSKITLASFTIPSTFSFGCWFKITDFGAYVGECILDAIIQVYPGGTKKINMWIGTTNREGTTVTTTNVWYHVFLTKSGGTQILYVNGVAEYTENSSTLDLTAFPNPQLGGRSDVGDDSYRLKGYMDDAIFFNRAITATEVLSIYKGGLTKKYMGVSNV